jgi:NhaP-type Na+/H+ or K+/H+ antiporter
LTERDRLLVGLCLVLVLGVMGQWAASRLKLPAILVLLALGLLAGPVALATVGYKVVDADRLLGDLLMPVVSLSVSIILFEGGLTLNRADLKHVGSTLWRLVTIGAGVTWVLTTLAASWVLGLPWQLSALIGAILVVTGPTVIGPLLRFVRPRGPVGQLLRWEGIVIDPIGATLALLVFESITTAHADNQILTNAAGAIVRTLAVGLGVGAAAAAGLVLLLRRFLVPDHLQSPMALMLVVAASTVSNLLQHEAGLLAVTVMGILLANQRLTPIGHILEFKESLSTLLIASLFILLGSRLDLDQLTGLGWRAAAFIAVLVLVVRPVEILASTADGRVPWNARLFLMGMAPRGIVAAAVASVFAERLAEAGFEQADRVVPVVFAVIIATVTIYGLGAAPLARRLGLATRGPGGFLVAGADRTARVIAGAIRDVGLDVLLVDTNYANVAAARMEDLPVVQGSATAHAALEQVDGSGIGRLLALTPNDEVNSLAALHFAKRFGRANVYQPAVDRKALPAKGEAVSIDLAGRTLFADGLTYRALSERIARGMKVKRTALTKEFGYEEFRRRYGDDAIPMFVSGDGRAWSVVSPDASITPRAGHTLISLVPGDRA